jgi:hypothetical protein
MSEIDLLIWMNEITLAFEEAGLPAPQEIIDSHKINRHQVRVDGWGLWRTLNGFYGGIQGSWLACSPGSMYGDTIYQGADLRVACQRFAAFVKRTKTGPPADAGDPALHGTSD